MIHSIRLYDNDTKENQVDFLDVIPDKYMSSRIIIRINDSIEFYTINQISKMVKYILLNTQYYFEIQKLR